MHGTIIERLCVGLYLQLDDASKKKYSPKKWLASFKWHLISLWTDFNLLMATETLPGGWNETNANETE